jgi:hypothetical protein
LSPTDADFDAAWGATEPRFSYALNRGLILLYMVLLGAFWVYWAVSVARGGLDLVLGVVGGLFFVVTVFVGFNILYWRHFARVSGALCTDAGLLWRHGRQTFSAPWAEIDFETLGLTDVDLSGKKYEYALNVGGKKLYLYRAHIRMRNMEIFMGLLLRALKDAGRIGGPENDAKPRKRGGKSSRGGRKGRK